MHAYLETLRAEKDRSATEVTQLRAELERLRAEMDRLGILGVQKLEEYRAQLERETAEKAAKGLAEHTNLQHRLAELRQQVLVTEEKALLQEAGVYEYQHPLHDAVAYQVALAGLQEQIKSLVKTDGGAVHTAVGWTVNGSTAQGRTMLRDYAKLMLRAYNAEADNLVRTLKPYKLPAAVERLGKVAATIVRLGKTMDIRIAEEYHRLRIRELGLTGDYQEKLAEEKERDREEKARLREERRLQQEIERERARLDKERQHYANALAALQTAGDTAGAAQLQERLAQIDTAIQDVDYRAANVRAGYVYVISNLGAFGEQMVKVGMTRRLDPMDRVRELGDASVPFTFDVHALFFADDAVSIEAQMHARLADRRVNLVNQRREFFYATPAEAKQHLMELTGSLLQYEEVPEALEYRQSRTQAQQNHSQTQPGAGRVLDSTGSGSRARL
ncbi:chromosome segregation ATPase [Actinoplanes awajinensis subsp. mycoplanecinus]|uniref:Chromosome segregation ATPase n=1 Tax=Actinoplanes awajinensis subsp. mycoplanecinus TaxID=135947 RepID=A0A101JJN2_9ACTN|nr:chromosome segregation ATPase [Actinoplanes awajinensis subsp. mycoplanecinus]